MISEEQVRARGIALLAEGEQHFRILCGLNPHWSKEERDARMFDWVKSRTKLWPDEE